MTLWFILSLVAIFYLLVSIFILYRLYQTSDDRFDTISLDSVKARLKTGDLIGVSYESMRGNLVKIFTGSVWTHVAMVVKIDQDFWILEIAHYNSEKSGVILTSWDEFIKWNRHRKLLYRPFHHPQNSPVNSYSNLFSDSSSNLYSDSYSNLYLNFPVRKLFKLLVQSKHFQMDTELINWLKAVVRTTYKPDSYLKKNHYYCSEYISFLLQKIGVMNLNFDPSSYQPWELLYTDLWTSHYKYDIPKLIIT